MSEVLSTPRFAMVRSDHYNDGNSLYDVVDNLAGTERVLAHRVRYQPACEIVRALNFRDQLVVSEPV